MATLEFLGTGASMGVPIIGCNCFVCQSTNPKDKRLRSSALLTWGEKKILIDCTPDFRTQALRSSIKELDGVILTHAHFDHTGGLDDLKVLYMWQKKLLRCLLSKETKEDVQQRFSYLFSKKEYTGHLKTKLNLELLPQKEGSGVFCDVPFQYWTYSQGTMPVNGFRFGDLAYITDIKEFDESLVDALKGIECLIVSALRWTPSLLHFSLDDAITFASRTGAKRTFLTHIAHDLNEERTNAYLPSNIRLAYDGLKIFFNLGNVKDLGKTSS